MDEEAIITRNSAVVFWTSLAMTGLAEWDDRETSAVPSTWREETTQAKQRPHGGNHRLKIFLIFLVMLIVVTATANIYGELAVVPGTMRSPLQRLSSSFILTSIGDGQVSGMKRLSLTVVRYPAKHTTWGWRQDSYISLDSSAYNHSTIIIVFQT